MNIVYILGISTYGGFEAKDATLDKEEADKWLYSETEPETMAVYKRIDWETAEALPRDCFICS